MMIDFKSKGEIAAFLKGQQEKLAQECESEFGWRAAHGRNRPYLTPVELAGQISVSTKTLYRWRCEGGGPRFIKIGKSVRYPFKELDAWAKAQSLSKSPQ